MTAITVTPAVLQAFQFPGEIADVRPYGSGHINDTFLVELTDGQRFILQHINKEVFERPRELMENIAGVTDWLRKKIIASGGDPSRETLRLRPAADGRSYYIDENEEYWRVVDFIPDTVCYDQVECADDFYNSALSFGHFLCQLADYPAHTLHESIPDFHNTPKRYETLERVVAADPIGIAHTVQPEIAFVRARREYLHLLTDKEASGELPLRVTHNDTKLNNILMDRHTGRGLCVIDLDTIMPGMAVNDFGDAIRFGANTAAEDERNLSKVSCDLEYFEAYAKGFIEGCEGALTPAELDCLIDGAIMMTLENGIRFLTEHIEDVHYHKIHRPGQNLDRARTQFALVEDMEKKRPQLEAIIKKYL